MNLRELFCRKETKVTLSLMLSLVASYITHSFLNSSWAINNTSNECFVFSFNIGTGCNIKFILFMLAFVSFVIYFALFLLMQNVISKNL